MLDVERVDEVCVVEDTNGGEQHVVRVQREIIKVQTTQLQLDHTRDLTTLDTHTHTHAHFMTAVYTRSTVFRRHFHRIRNKTRG